MPIHNDRAIDALCNIIDGFPVRRSDALFWACVDIGLQQEATGLPSTPDRTVRQLFWDFTVADLQAGLETVINEYKITAETIVSGIVAQLARYFSVAADPNNASKALDNQLDFIQRLKDQLELPESERSYPGTTDRIRDAIAKFEEFAADFPKNRREAEEALEYLQARVAETFTDEFWASLIEITPDELPGM